MSKLLCVLRYSLPFSLENVKPLQLSCRSVYVSHLRFDANKKDNNDTDDTTVNGNVQNESFNSEKEVQEKLEATTTVSPDGETHDDSSRSEKQHRRPMGKDDVEKKKEAQEKMKELLRTMSKIDPAEKVPHVQVPRARDVAHEKAKKDVKSREQQQKVEKKEIGPGSIDSKLEEAASKLAEKLGGDTKQTERELLEIYLTRGSRKVVEEESEEPETYEQDEEEEQRPDMKDLLRSLKVEKETPAHQSRAHQVRIYKTDNKVIPIPRIPLSRAKDKKASRIDIFGAEPLNIFTTDDEGKTGPAAESVVWKFLDERDVRLSVTHTPANIFEQLIQWTEEGKIWKFPINNEQGWEEENVDFTEHVFLEHMLEPWCPSTGLIRHFMELVCVGLSKNPYLTVQEKHAHIIFYEHYFRKKNRLLVDLGLEPIKDRPQSEQMVASV